MTRPRQHHYLPASYLAGFTENPSQPTVHVYEVGQSIRKTSPRREARIRDLYLVRGEGVTGDEVEQYLSRIESDGIAVIRNIVVGERLFSADERKALALFMGLMFTRTPAALEYGERFTAPAAKRLLKALATDREAFHKEITDFAGHEDAAGIEDIRLEILSGYYENRAPEPNEHLEAMIAVGKIS